MLNVCFQAQEVCDGKRSLLGLCKADTRSWQDRQMSHRWETIVTLKNLTVATFSITSVWGVFLCPHGTVHFWLIRTQTDKPVSCHMESVKLEQRVLHISRYMQLTGLSAAVCSFKMCGLNSQIRSEGIGWNKLRFKHLCLDCVAHWLEPCCTSGSLEGPCRLSIFSVGCQSGLIFCSNEKPSFLLLEHYPLMGWEWSKSQWRWIRDGN